MKKTLLSIIKNIVLLSLSVLIFGCWGAKDTYEESSDMETKTEQSATTYSTKPIAKNQNKKITVTREDFVIDELNDELKKVRAELKYITAEVQNLKAKSEIWTNPISVYNKEIIMDNGSTVFGQIIYQDKKIIKVETLIGHLILNRTNVVRIVENIPDETIIKEAKAHEIDQATIEEALNNSEIISRRKLTDLGAEVILLGTISEVNDNSENTIFSGELKNVGAKRADFVRVNFIFRKNWSGETKTLTAFVNGTNYTFDSGVSSDASILPASIAPFELVVEKSFGSIVGYTYTIDWEEYE
ncbi:MAG: hypothetical protein ISR90_06020 [Candidatus Marinimicrobia bacterium]|nr:hypothetical protein [Candidatus Neomarinimicrobiota bacterium]MBL7023589.1 hypothetical protein [Candidatus Neomarinimicrobiota bacterium]MBL7109519.1 hypothetical protein [Candidatus Neomarinimicrobiota bacterium]